MNIKQIVTRYSHYKLHLSYLFYKFIISLQVFPFTLLLYVHIFYVGKGKCNYIVKANQQFIITQMLFQWNRIIYISLLGSWCNISYILLPKYTLTYNSVRYPQLSNIGRTAITRGIGLFGIARPLRHRAVTRNRRPDRLIRAVNERIRISGCFILCSL